jgi:hypothetical protein
MRRDEQWESHTRHLPVGQTSPDPLHPQRNASAERAERYLDGVSRKTISITIISIAS